MSRLMTVVIWSAILGSVAACSSEGDGDASGTGGSAGGGSGEAGVGAGGGTSETSSQSSASGGATTSAAGGSTGGSGGTSTFDPGKLCEVTANDTALKIAARSMTAGEWKNIPAQYPGGVSRDDFFRSSTGANNHLDYAESASWDEAGRCLFYYGGGHNSQPAFLRWCEQTSTWASLGRPQWINFSSSNVYDWFVHAYDRNTFDVATRTHYFVAGSVWAYDVDAGSWSEGPEVPAPTGFAGNSASYFPGMGLVELNEESSEVTLLPPQSTQWQVLRNDTSVSYHNFLEHNRTSNLMLLGGGTGGNGSRNVYVLDASRVVHGPFATSITLGTSNYGAGGWVTEDPHSGGFIFLENNGDVHAISVSPNGVSMSPRPASPLGDIGNGVTTVVADYGIILYALGDRDDSLWLYKPAGEPCP